jgi:opacity protein-like surface antigen
MRNLLLAAAAAISVASPALAADHSGYFEVDAGVLFPAETHVDGKVTDAAGSTVIEENDIFGIKYTTGYDLDLIGGYDLGLFRLEGELGYKQTNLDRLAVDQAVLNAISDYADVVITPDDLSLDGRARVFSGMINGLIDTGGAGFSAFVGGGAGLANVKFSGGGLSSSDSAVAWQLLAGVRTAISPGLEFGIKYRYFRTGNLKFSDTIDVDGDSYKGTLSGHFNSHSLLASFVYNFGTQPVAARQGLPPAMPPAPPTQTCADGSVVLATNACPTEPESSTSAAPQRGEIPGTIHYGLVTKVPANTPSGYCLIVPDDYIGTGAANMPAVTTGMPRCSSVK